MSVYSSARRSRSGISPSDHKLDPKALTSLIVLDLFLESVVLRGARKVRGDDVDPDAAVGEVVERGEAPSHREGTLVGHRLGDAKGEVLGHRRRGADEEGGVRNAKLSARLDCCVGVSAIDLFLRAVSGLAVESGSARTS